MIDRRRAGRPRDGTPGVGFMVVGVLGKGYGFVRDDRPQDVNRRVAYIALQFPTLSETFVSNEIAGLLDLGWEIDVYPLWPDRSPIVHPQAALLTDLARWRHPLSAASLRANARMLLRRPRRYLSTLRLIVSDLPAHPLRTMKSIALFPTMVWIASDLASRRHLHVHAHFASHQALAALVARSLAGVTYSFTAHAHDVYVSPSLIEPKVRHAAFVVAISDYNRRLLELIQSSDTPLHVVHCGVQVPATLPPIDGERKSILCVGRLTAKKGQRYLIDACRILRDRGIDVSCTIVGGGEDRELLRSMIRAAELEDVVSLTGPLASDAVAEQLRQAAVFVLPSVVLPDGNAEGIPVALMEAMAAGVPVISTWTTGIPELIEDGVSGFLVEPEDSQALASAIERLLVEPQLRDQLRQQAFASVRANFSANDSIRELGRLFEHETALENLHTDSIRPGNQGTIEPSPNTRLDA